MVRTLVIVLALCALGGAARAGESPAFTIAGGGAMPMVGSDVRVTVRGPIAQVRHIQRFYNPSTTPIEAVYTFPLPAAAAVNGMVMHLGPRTITAQIERREEATRRYQQARQEGKTAALLTQERPNIFTQAVHGILPDEAIDVVLTYDILLEPDGDWYELAIPTVVGPRYIPGAARAGAASGTGHSPDTAQVPDAARISPGINRPGTTPQTTYAFALDLEAGFPLAEVDCPTHAIDLTELGPTHVAAALASPDTVADKDVVVRWRLEVGKPTVRVLGASDRGVGYVAATIQPPRIELGAAPPRELVFVLDTSGSMSGEPLALVKQGVRYALDQLRPTDTFRIINFSSDVSGFESGAELPAKIDNLRRARSWLNRVGAGGGTEMLGGIRAALASPPAPPAERYVVFFTDGYIGNEKEILAEVRRARSANTYLFSFGVGSSVNRYLLEDMARLGNGASEVIVLDDPAEPQIARLFARLGEPVWSDVAVDFPGLAVNELTPSTSQTLFAGRPLVITGRYAGGGVGAVRVRAKVRGRALEFTQPVALPETGGDILLYGRLWARMRIRELTDPVGDGDWDAQAARMKRATELALTYSLLSATTAFIAVDDRRRLVGPATPTEVPVELPEGVSFSGATTSESIYIIDRAPAIDPTSTTQGITIDTTYTKNIPVPGRTFESTLATAAGSQSDGLGVAFGGGARGGSGRASGELAARVRGDDGAAASAHLSLGLRLDARYQVGADAGLVWRATERTRLELLATLTRWRLWRWLGLRLGFGLDGDLAADVHAAWRVDLLAPLGGLGRLRPMLTLGAIDSLGDDAAPTPTAGVGLAF